MSRHDQISRQWRLLRQLEQAGVRRDHYGGEATPRKRLWRDIQSLESAGFPIVSVDDDEGRPTYRLVEGFRRLRGGVPLAASEILALRAARAFVPESGAGFAEALGELIEKLDVTLSPAQRAFARQLDSAVVRDPFGGLMLDSEARAVFDPLLRALQQRRSLDISYRDQRGRHTRRRIDPYNLWAREGRAYIVAHCQLRKAMRTFLLHRIEDASETEASFEMHDDYRFEDYASEGFRVWRDGVVHQVKIRFTPSAALYVRERTWHPTQRIDLLPDGGLELHLEAEGLPELASWILSFGPRARAVAPDALVELCRREMRAALDGYPARQP